MFEQYFTDSVSRQRLRRIVNDYPYDVDLLSGRYIVDGKLLWAYLA